MHEDPRHLALSFPAIPVGGKETPPNLRRLLYKGGASVRVDQADQAIQDGLLGNVQNERIELVRLIHEFISGDLAGGGSPVTAKKQISEITLFFRWSEEVGAALNVSEVEGAYLDWSEHLLQRIRVVKDLNNPSAYTKVRIVGQVLDQVLGRAKPIARTTRLRSSRTRKTSQAAKTDKQNLQATFAFGRLLQDICDGTPLGVIRATRQLRIPLYQGGQIEFRPIRRDSLLEDDERLSLRQSKTVATAYETDLSMNHRFRREMLNLRIQAELLLFIGQTGMNLTQASQILMCRFSYSSDIDSYKVREYKPRRMGEVLFEVFSEYRAHFERYLEWRRELFPEMEKRVFPLIRKNGIREDRKVKFDLVKSACKKSEVTWTSPRTLRGTRVNWLLRRSGDPDVTAEMAQHHKRTLLNVYEIPSQQRAVSEIIRFHLGNDPALDGKTLLVAVAPGECDGTLKPSPTKPETASEPDCQRPSGCLWCEHHRDIDSLDYVWSLACFRHLKILELSQILPTKKESKVVHPAEHAIQRLSEKLSWFRDSNSNRREWVEESIARVEEGYYHDQWSYIIETIEGPSQ